MKRINITYLLLSILLILFLSLGTGCNLLLEEAAEPPPATVENGTEEEVSTSPESPAAGNEDNTSPDWSVPAAGEGAPVLPGIADVVARVKPSVVAIETEVTLVDFFRGQYTQEGAGSGWIISEDGYVVTNNHVVEGAETISVILDDERVIAAEVVGTDRLTDLAVLRIDAENLVAAAVGDSLELRIGDWVVAIGNSLGQGIRATQGIVSRKDVSIQVDQGQELQGLIETDAAINPGNSGGPLVNMAGEVIGINSVKHAEVGVEGVGYAISTSEAIPIIRQLINTGYVVRPWLGVSLYTVDEFVVSRYDLKVDEGVFVVTVAAGSPADKAGLEPGDVITSFASQEVPEVNALIRGIHTAQVGQSVEIIYWRGETETATQATLIESPAPP